MCSTRGSSPTTAIPIGIRARRPPSRRSRPDRHRSDMKRNEHGIALVITLFLMATLSALAVSMMFLAQTETAASRNYRTMSQARYAAEAGVHEMANYLMNTGYTPTANYDATKSPVTCTGGSCAHSAGANSCTGTSIATAVSTG